ncbi:MAG: hypothetical protein J5I90_07995 [Caldilineales bacterium]|nr:hypothetical protein [Caldilineales bacterium]
MAKQSSSKRSNKKPRDWKTTVWYVLGALIVLSMVFSLFAAAFSGGRF